jgi:hypothetical protein
MTLFVIHVAAKVVSLPHCGIESKKRLEPGRNRFASDSHRVLAG